jgi:hypothetical protein
MFCIYYEPLRRYNEVMRNLVIAVSPDSSLQQLGEYADIMLLDKDQISDDVPFYDTVYIRSHFSRPDMQPQNFRGEIEDLIQKVQLKNPAVTFIDSMDTADNIVAFEDKWNQYQLFAEFMPHTERLNQATTDFRQPIFKKRLSSRGSGITWSRPTESTDEWLVQESLDIAEELRIYVVHQAAFPIVALRQSMTTDQKTIAVDARAIAEDERIFAEKISQSAQSAGIILDLIGLDIARTTDGQLKLLEANRSPGFAAFAELTGQNLADTLYAR